nr:hypothetical protein [Massilia sp. YMA4]
MTPLRWSWIDTRLPTSSYSYLRDDGRSAFAGGRRNGGLRQQPAHRIVLELADQRPLRAADHPVRPIPFDIGNQFSVQVDLVQVARTVVQVVQHAPIGQGGLHAVAQLVVGVAQR